jgi:hypothetical protein
LPLSFEPITRSKPWITRTVLLPEGPPGMFVALKSETSLKSSAEV